MYIVRSEASDYSDMKRFMLLFSSISVYLKLYTLLKEDKLPGEGS